ncbi:sulfatase-like hydrolase/transferase [Phenylobacterium sp.]|jgi:arylsulfatase A-like enzyme|uniref:sulfatase-like hydrolase/transferase n=1 Tax=Phenylobacterium sp. TaxID=1871053 RepID=UPI002F412A1C
MRRSKLWFTGLFAGVLATAGVCLAGLALPQARAFAQPAKRPPNIIMILADDLGYADISAYKIDRFHTPNIDRIGMQGVRFTDGYASAPVCGPSRAGLQTGRYQERFGFEYNNGPAARDLKDGYGVDTNEITLAQLLKKQGYHTGLVGKWHLGMQDKFYPTNRGYDEFVGFLPGQTSYMDPDALGLHKILPGGDGNADAPAGQKAEAVFRRNQLAQIYEGPEKKVVHNEDQYLTDYFAARDVDYIKRASASGKPYFLYAAFNAVHEPFMVTQKYYDRFPQIKNEQQRIYAAMVASLDDAVGQILDAVQASGQADNTIVVFASDNGCAAYVPGLCSCEPLRGGKLSHYEGGTRVPFMMRWPGHIQPGLVYRNVVSLMDVLPTSVAVAGGKLPTDRVYDGVDIMPFITGRRTGEPHDMLVWRRRPLVSIRKGDWKLWESVDDKTGVYGEYKLLFNLKTDLNESTNLADKHPEKVKELEGLIHQWAKDMTDPKWPSRPAVKYNVCGTPFVVPI